MKDTAKKPILVIMAAGMGSRFGGLKQIEAVGPPGKRFWITACSMPTALGLKRSCSSSSTQSKTRSNPLWVPAPKGPG